MSIFFVAVYLISLVALSLISLAWISIHGLSELPDLKLILVSAIIGGLGGQIYCLRGIYITVCVKKSWDTVWLPWYFLRPLVSILCGGVSYLFLKAGLLILESGPSTNASELGFYALAFVAGLNVDKFIQKIEDIAQAVWGIEKSNSSKKD